MQKCRSIRKQSVYFLRALSQFFKVTMKDNCIKKKNASVLFFPAKSSNKNKLFVMLHYKQNVNKLIFVPGRRGFGWRTRDAEWEKKTTSPTGRSLRYFYNLHVISGRFSIMWNIEILPESILLVETLLLWYFLIFWTNKDILFWTFEHISLKKFIDI